MFVCCIGISNFAFAQPANNAPCSATPLTANAGCVYTAGTNIGSNNSTGGGIPAPTCAAYSGVDVWYSVVVPPSGGINITTAGSMDGALALYTGTCTTMSQVACNDDFNGLMPYISSPSLTVGSTVWICYYGFAGQTGNFNICVTAAPPPPPPCNAGNSCLTPNCITTNPTLTMCNGIPSIGGGGIYGCLGGAPNPLWNVFQSTITGPITMGANSPGPDIDYVLWGPFSSPAAGCAGLSAANILSCNFSTSGSNSFTFNAIAGQSYVLLTTNWSNQTGVTVNWPVNPAGSISCSSVCTATAGSNSPICAGSALNLTCNAVAGATLYHWTGPNGFNVNGQNQSIPAATLAAAGTYTVTVTAGASNCVGTVSVVVNPLPNVSNLPPASSVCSGTLVNYTPLIAPVAGGTYSWTATANPAGSVTGFPASGSGPIAYTLTNTGTTAGTVTYVITPIGTAPTLCHGANSNYVVTVNPPPTITNPPPQQFICSGSSATYAPTSNTGTATFSYTASSANGVTGFTAAGTGNINDVLINNGTAAGTVVYVITPIGDPPTNCPGTPVNLIVNVYPAPSVSVAGPNQNVCGSTATLAGNVPTVGVGTWTSISGGAIVTNISLNNSGVTGLAMGPNVFEWVITNAPCPPSQSQVTITQDPVPTITNPVLTQTICSGSNAIINPTASVAGSTFTWTATSSAGTVTGFSAAGAGNISEAITNSGTTSETVTYVVTPTGPAPSFCVGTPSSFVVTVDPIPTITNAVLTQSFCSGNMAFFAPVADVAGCTFAWTASSSAGTITGFSANGNGTINEMITNAGSAQGTVTYVITPTGPAPSFCVGSPVNFVVTVDPAPSVTNNPLTQDICSGSNGTLNPITSNVALATFAWTSSSSAGTTTGNTAVGAGNINEVLTNTGNTQGTVTYVITASSPGLGCPGTPANFLVNVDPIPTVTNVTLTQEICASTAATFTPTSNVLSTTYTWTASGSSANVGGFSANGSGNINEVLTNSGTAQETVTYVITPTGPATTLCVGTPVNFVVSVDPVPTITNPVLTQNFCSAGTATFTPVSNQALTTFTWTATASSANVTGFSANGNGNINEAVSNSGNTPETVTYVMTPTGPAPLFCPGTPVNFVVTVDPIPTISNATLTQTICSNGTATFNPTSNVTGATYAFTASGSSANVIGFTAAGNGNISDILTNSGSVPETVTYTVTPTGPATTLCPGTPSNFVVTVDPIPTVTNLVLTQNFCSGGTATFVPTSNVVGSTFSWTATASAGTITGFSASGTGNINEVINNTGTTQGTVTYVITPTGPGSSFCPGPASNFVVTVDPTPTITNNPLTQTFCSGGTASLNIVSNVVATTFTWTATSSSANVTGFTAAGNGNISEVLTNTGNMSETVTYDITPTGPGLACPGTNVSYVVTVDPIPDVSNVTLTQSFCSGGSATFNPTSSVVGTTFTWTASASQGTITGFSASGSGNINETITNTGAAGGTVTYIITPTGPSANGCIGNTVNFVVNVDPIADVTNNPLTQAFCVGGTATLIPTSSVTGTTFNWTTTASAGTLSGFSANGTGNISEVLSNTGAQPETVTYTITPVGPGLACPVTPVNFVVTVNPTPTVTNATLTQTICSGSTATFTPTSVVTGTIFTWTASASSASITGFSASGTGNITDAIANSGGTGTVTYVITPTSPPTASCVGPTSNFVVTVNPNPVPVVANNGPVCLGSQLDLSANTYAGGVYSWTGPNGFVSALEDPTVNAVSTLAMAGTYHLTVTVLGCPGTDSTTVVVNPIPTATVTGGSSVCFGSTPAPVSIALTGNGPWNITYSNGTGTTSVVANSSPFVIVNPATGSYSVVSLSDANCTGTSIGTAIVVVNPIPVAGLTPDVVTGCTPVCVTYTNTSSVTSGNISTWAWDFGDGGTDNTQTPNTHCYAQAGSYTVTLQVTTAAGCTATSVYTNLINVTSYPVANFECVSSASIYTPTIQFNNYSTGADSYVWDFGDLYNIATDSSHEQNPSHTYSHVGSYCVLLTAGNAGMCYDTMTICVTITPEFTCFIPNAFSPNHDGINDDFFCKATNVLTFEMTIYDRWGNKIFFTDDVEKHWDGDVNENRVVGQEDVYVYIIHIKDINKEKHDYIGNVTLVR